VDVRLVRAEEWEELRDLRLLALTDAPDAFGATHAESVDRPEAYWRGWILGEGWDGTVRTWVADDRGRFRGMAVGARFDADASALNLFGMWVAPELRGTTIASRLVGMAEAWGHALAAGRIVLRVSEGNARAEAFYAKLGFRRTDTAATPLREGSTVLVHEMERSLAPTGDRTRTSVQRVGEP
jgi:RimJ/RimL family protein N-acetyltransferase